MSVLNGALSYRKSTNDFYVNETGTNDGWVPLPLSIDPEELTNIDANRLLEKLGRGNKYQYFVDGSNPNASDSKDNNGRSKLRPFRTLERALLEVARRSLEKGSNNDIYEQNSILVSPGEYTISNSPSSLSLSNDFLYFDQYQNASRLILRNADWIVNEAWEAVPSAYRTETYRQELKYFLNALANDLSSGGNNKSIKIARTIVTSDKNLNFSVNPEDPNAPGIPDPGYFIDAYDNIAPNENEREVAIIALETLRDKAILAMRNLAPYKDLSLTIDSTADEHISNKINELIKIITDTLNCFIDPRELQIIYGSFLDSFPVKGEPNTAIFQSFNSLFHSGVILPRGVSIIGEDLRKVIFRPKYVPNRDGSEGRGAIFRMTGGNFFSGFTIKDNKEVAKERKSHHNLSVFEFCSRDDLEDYYEKVLISFKDKTIHNKILDTTNLLNKNIEWIVKKSVPPIVEFNKLNYAKIFESEIHNFIISIIKDLRAIDKKEILEFGQRFRTSHILTLSPELQNEVAYYYNSLIDSCIPYIQLAIINEANTAEGGYQDPYLTENIEILTANYPINSTNILTGRYADILATVYTYRDIVKKSIFGEDVSIEEIAKSLIIGDNEIISEEINIVTPIGIEEIPGFVSENANSVYGASPYIFSASLRSEYGMCGIDGDGGLVGGLKSYLAAQFTIISLQRDDTTIINDNKAQYEIQGKRYIGSRVADTEDKTHFGYRVSNGAYSQLVSCFCIGPARHYIAESGGEFSITNSTSNFGDISLYSHGFNDYRPNQIGSGSYIQDQDHKIVGIIRPKSVVLDDITQARDFSLGSISSYSILNSDSLESNPFDSSFIPPDDWIDWTNTYGTEQNGVIDWNYPDYSEFTDIKYIKLVLKGALQNDLGPSFRYINNEYDSTNSGIELIPDLKFLYCSAPYTANDPNNDPILSSQYPEAGYNNNLIKNRRAEVMAIRVIKNNEELFTELILDVSSGPEVVGEWFERGIIFNAFEGPLDEDDPNGPTRIYYKSRLITELIGSSVFAKRFVDTREIEDKKYKIIFRRNSIEKRIPPDAYILRKGNVSSLALQPFKKDNLNRDTIFYNLNTQLLSENVLKELDFNTSITKNSNFDDLFYTEFLSGNFDEELGLQYLEDLSENAKFYFTEDAEILIGYKNTNPEILSALVNDPKYIEDGIINKNRFLELNNIKNILTLGLGSVPNDIEVDYTGSLDRIIEINNSQVFEFNKPSTIRASGHTWEYCGYYNYSTSLPILQNETLGDRLELTLKKPFKFKKIQNVLLGGRIYATGMDELGNVIQGNTIIDLKTGKSETIFLGTTPEVQQKNIEFAGDTGISDFDIEKLKKIFAQIDSPTFIGIPQAPTPDITDNTKKIATTEYVKDNLSLYALLDSPEFEGTPRVPTPSLIPQEQEFIDQAVNIEFLNDTIDARLQGHIALPLGAIIMWSGNDVLPDGWCLCDGSPFPQGSLNGNTPDLRDKFIMGGGEINISTQGGANSKNITIDNLPSHYHTIGSYSNEIVLRGSAVYDRDPLTGAVLDSTNGQPYQYPTGISIAKVANFDQGNYRYLDNNNDIQLSISDGITDNEEELGTLITHDTGGNIAFDVRPAYYVLAFIIKYK